MDQNAFVERAVRFQKLVTPDQLLQAKAAVHPDKSLLQALLELGFIRESDADSIRQLFEKGQGMASAPLRPASAPAAQPARPAPAPALGAVPAQPAAAPPPQPVITLDLDPARVAGLVNLEDLLGYAREVDASDLHITVGSPPVIRRYGRLITLPRDPFRPEETERLLTSILTPEQRASLEENLALDFCANIAGQGRYRSCIVKQRLGWDGSFRIIPSRLPTFEELGLPEQVKRLTEFHQGLVLVTGPMGCGKSTTMAAMVELINQTREDHIITLEDPIEYEIKPKSCQVNQRECNTHTKSFSNALRAALREDPDVIVIGEMRDLETVSLAITAAETGHLVFGTLHTTSAARTIDRILDVFPPDEQTQVRSMISESIRGIVCQQLIPRKDGKGRALALEILFNTPAVANIIRERKLFQIPSVLMTGKKQGMVLLDNSLLELANQGIIDGTDAFFAADNKGPFAKWAPQVAGRPVES